MREPAVRRWQQWRVTLTARPAPAPAAGRFDRPVLAADPTPIAAAEPPGPDGIRHELVARVRREIEAGTYDTEAKWLAAEERLLRWAEEMI